MTGNTDDELTPSEREALASLDRKAVPPATLEERTVVALRREGLLSIGRARSGRPWLRPAWVGLGIAVALAIGLMAGRLSAPAAELPDFILILRAGPLEFQAPNHEEMMRRVGDYANWARAAREDGALITGEKLRDGGRLLGPAATGFEAAALPRESAPGSVQGYFLIRSPTYEDAVRIAGDCPHLRYGGEIELRRIERFDGGQS